MPFHTYVILDIPYRYCNSLSILYEHFNVVRYFICSKNNFVINAIGFILFVLAPFKFTYVKTLLWKWFTLERSHILNNIIESLSKVLLATPTYSDSSLGHSSIDIRYRLFIIQCCWIRGSLCSIPND